MKQVVSFATQFVWSLGVWLFVALATLVVFIFIAMVHPFDRNGRVSQQIANLWGRSIVWINPLWHLTVSGQSRIKKNQTYVIVANHSSLADIVCIYCILKDFKWIAKESLFKIPVLGWTMSLLKYIPLKRGTYGSIRETMETARKYLEKNVSVLFFSEGTRSKSGHLSPFKNGAFKLAIEVQKPILPIVISGTEQVLQKGKLTMAAGMRGFLKALPPVDVREYGPDDFERLKEKVWKMMNEELVHASG